MNFNKAIIVGNVTKDPEIRTTPSGQNVASVGVATNRVWNTNSGEKQEKTEFHNVVAWGKLAEICGQYLTKGQLVLFEGRIETRSWDGQDGVKRYKTQIVAENMQMGPRVRSQENAGGSYQSPVREENKNAPQVEVPKEQNSEQGKGSDSGEEEIKIEDIPF